MGIKTETKPALSDTHAHLHFEHFADDLPRVVRRAQEAGVRKILTLGTDLPSSQESLQIADRFKEVYAAVGIHPTEVHKTSPEDIPVIKELANSQEKVVAIGEIGLDLYWKEVPLTDQLPVLERMLEIAQELDLPVVIHNRDAQPEMQRFFRQLGIRHLKGVMHSFAGTADDARFYLELGLHISFTGVITFKNFKQMEVVKTIPPDHLLLETDSPFLAPVPYRGKRNEPAFVRYIAQKLAEIHQMSLEEICKVTSENARKLFGW